MERGLIGLAELAGATAADRDDATWVVWPGRGPAFNFATRIRWPESTPEGLDARIDGLVRWARDDGQLPSVLLVEELTEPQVLAERLRERGWLGIARETVHWTGRAAVVPHLDPQLRIESVTPRVVPVYEEVERAIFGLSASDADDRRAALERTIADGRVRAFLVRLRGEPVATARLADLHGLAVVHGVGVVTGHRREGYGRLVTTVATRAGLATGHRLVWLSVDPDNEAARTLYENLDFRPCLSWQRIIGMETP
jgi:ribosomal protein S18 acetylase RimI-like enzyme